MNARAIGRARYCGLVAALLLVPAAARAHDLSDRYGAYLGAALHPLTAFDHLLAFLAVGLLAGQQQAPAVWRVAAAFIAGLLIGVGLSTALPLSPEAVRLINGFNLVSFMVLGGLVAAAPRLPPRFAAALAALFGASHGLENGLDLLGKLSLPSVLGLLTAGLLAVAPIAALVCILRARLRAAWPVIAVRVLGSWIAAIGLIVLGLRFRS